jgi:2-polyprenyl-6-methoxyphenol hydroxylase-like FAD-dependent oxidoreductase
VLFYDGDLQHHKTFTMNKKTKKQHQIQVAIIGAGIGGLCLAQGLRKNNISFKIFEKDLSPNSRPQGFRIRIDEMGQKALSACLSEDHYQLFKDSCAIPYITVNTLNTQLESYTNERISSWLEYAEIEEIPDLRANRITMREVLLAGLDKHIHFNKEFINYEELSNGKTMLHFNDGTSYEADVIVAADGINSKLCALRFPKNNLIDTGNVNVYGKTFYSSEANKQIAEILQSRTSVIFDKEISLIVDAMQFNDSLLNIANQSIVDVELSPMDDYIYWAFIGNRERLGLSKDESLQMGQDKISSLVKEMANSWHTSLKSLFQLVDQSTLTITAVKTSFPKDSWISTKITALGDAIHAMSPAGGAGANSALYDASILTENLSKVNLGEMDLLQAITDYEEKMRSNSRNTILDSQKAGESLYGKTSMAHE